MKFTLTYLSPERKCHLRDDLKNSKHILYWFVLGGYIMECCGNPWNSECENRNIVVYILFEGKKRAICRRCWGKIAKEDSEW